MQNTIKLFKPQDGINAKAHRKESGFVQELTLVDTGKKKELATVRIYETKQTVFCCVWIRGIKGAHASGSGRAGGYGYHMASHAMQEALDSAGVKLAKDIDGRGDSAMRGALEALARFAGLRSRFMILQANA